MRERNNNSIVENEIMSQFDNAAEQRAEQIVFGWNSVDDAAADLFKGMHKQLLDGKPIFLFKNTTTKSDLIQLVVVQNLDWINDEQVYTDYSVSMITAGWSAIYPHVTEEYLSGDILCDLEKYKIDRDVIETYKQIIKRLK